MVECWETGLDDEYLVSSLPRKRKPRSVFYGISLDTRFRGYDGTKPALIGRKAVTSQRVEHQNVGATGGRPKRAREDSNGTS